MGECVGCRSTIVRRVMKTKFISIGLAAAGTASLHAAYMPDMNDSSKIWSLSASLRTFYDDNYTTVSAGKHGSFGVQLSPQVEINTYCRQREFGAQYINAVSYYEQRDSLGQDPFDQTHQFDLWVDHAFTERWQARVQDSFVVAQEPELLAPSSTPLAVKQRVSGNNIVNTARISLHTDWTRLFSTEIAYQNTLYDYENRGGNAASPSRAGLLNRLEHLASIDFQWHVSRPTMVFVGYQYGLVNYTGNEVIAQFPPVPLAPLIVYRSNSRDNDSHYGYVGVQHSFLENLTGNVRLGAQYTDNYNDPHSTTSIGPYASASLVYTYSAGSYAQIGLTHSRNATDQIAPDTTGHITQDQESTIVYSSVNHRLTPKLTAS